MHKELSSAKKGRREDRLSVINRSVMIFISACWESYVEDIVIESFDFILTEATNSSQIPIRVRMKAIDDIVKSEDKRRIWEISDNNWKKILIKRKDEILEDWIGDFHTPKAKNVDKLFADLLGITQISLSWYWQKMDCTKASKKLDEFVTIRGNIAHRTPSQSKNN
ncbi:hypothetical protein CH376_23650 [Leptospira adleri]|uniref:RiboL-PSP-HEPN domain-containing protein n=1 Tax=Leptospira adleri TaxID=2023186 RepID=A0ABX4NRK1_9LEPT|nr:hypothetical protein CH376_23650 [Leptospira adleri]